MAAGLHQGAGRLEKMAGATAPSSLLLRSLVAILAILFALSLHRAFIANINWDEFSFLSFVYSFRNGTLSIPLQTFHVHLFAWLPLVSDDEIHQIFAARSALWLLSVATGVLIYRIARLFCSREAALFSVLFYFGFSHVVDHGLSFRYDPICAFLFLVSVYLLLGARRSRVRLALSGIVMAAAMMISIKSVFYLGTIGTIFLALFLFEESKSTVAKNALVYVVAFGGSFFVLYQVHDLTLANTSQADTSTFIKTAGTKTLLSLQFLPRINTAINALTQNGPFWVFVLLGMVFAGKGVITGADRKRNLILLSFALPLLSLLIYRNAYPYFYVFLMPAAVILGGVFADVLIGRFRESGSKIAPLVVGGTVLMISGSVVGDYVRKFPDQTTAQAEIVALVHQMFPEPTAYIDRNSMISSYPKVGFVMSTWGMEKYLAGKTPVMDGLIRREQPKFMIANSCALDILGLQKEEQEFCQYRLMNEDLEVLRANFIHHWGAIYVAGKTLQLETPLQSRSFEILIPGTYTLEADSAVLIDGKIYQPGEQVRLDMANHSIAALNAATPVVLRFGVNLYNPSHEPSSQPIYYRF